MVWKWKEDSGNSNERVYRCEAFKNNREMIKKAQNRTFRLSDIPSEGRKALASETKLDSHEFEKWGQLRDVSVYREAVYISVRIEKVWMLSSREDWKWESKGGGGETVTYTCPGWRCTEDILTKIRNRTISSKDIPMTARDRLASIVELDKNEIGQWGRLTVTADNSRGIFVSIETPNIWITADILKDGERFVDPLAAIGGSIGAFYHKMMPSGKCKKSCENFQSLLNELTSENNKGKIWGFVLYAHGSRAGAIAETSSSEKKNYQTELLAAVEKYGYKFAEIHLMQCYSGYKGVIITNKKDTDELFIEPRKKQFKQITEPALVALKKAVDAEEKAEIAKSLQKKLTEFFAKEPNMQYISCRVFPRLTKEKGIYFDYVLRLSINWEARWQNYAIKLKTYQDLNVMLIDTGIFK